jgi:hypothetical protein
MPAAPGAPPTRAWPSSGVLALAIDPNAPTTLYAGTDTGVFKSADAAGTWTAIGTAAPELYGVQALAVDPHTSGTLYAGTAPRACAEFRCGGVFKSTDAANTWSTVNTGLTNPGVQALAIDPLTPGRLYTGTLGTGVLAIQQVETPTPAPTSTRTPTATPVEGGGSSGCTLTPITEDGGRCVYLLVPMWFCCTDDGTDRGGSRTACLALCNSSHSLSAPPRRLRMCRNIKTLFNFEPPVTDAEIRAASLQFVRKISGFNKPSKANEAAVAAAVDGIARIAGQLLDSLESRARPRHREEEAAKARARAAQRFGA